MRPRDIPNQQLQLVPSWVLVLLTAQQIAVEEKPVVLEMLLHIQEDHPKNRLKKGPFSPQNGPPHGTTARETPHSTPLCNHFVAQTQWKKNHPHCRHLLDAPAFVLNFKDNHPENSPKTAIGDTKSAIKQARRLKMAQNLLQVMCICCAVI